METLLSDTTLRHYSQKLLSETTLRLYSQTLKFPSSKLGKFRKVYFKIRDVSEQSEISDNCKYCDCLTILVQVNKDSGFLVLQT